MAITLRADKGSALTHDQVDTNFTSFIYSASLSGGTLTFFTTGSTGLGLTSTSSSFSLVSDGFWTGSGGNISRLSTVTVSGSFIQGNSNTTLGIFAHAQGLGTQAGGNYSHAEGYQTQATGLYSHAEGSGTTALTTGSHAEGLSTQARGSYSHAEGRVAIASGSYSHAEGQNTLALGAYSHAEGDDAQAIGTYSHAEGFDTIASGDYSHAEGNQTIASGSYSHAEGDTTEAIGETSHAEGFQAIANGIASHAEGNDTIASGSYSHAEGYTTQALGTWSHAEGFYTQARGNVSHAEGSNTQAIGVASHAEGWWTVASGSYQHVQGQYNISSSVESAFIIGNGTSDGSRSNLVFAAGNTFQVTGSLVVSSGSSPELTVTGTGVTLGNISTDTHRVTGSLNISGSLNATGTVNITGNGVVSNFMYANVFAADNGAYILDGLGSRGMNRQGGGTNIFTSDNSVGITFNSGSYLANVRELMRITPSGSVGIGTSTPTGSLDISGSTRINDILTLVPRTTTPTGILSGSFIVSGSGATIKPYFWDGSAWNALY